MSVSMSLIDSALPVSDSSSVSTIGDEEDEFAEKKQWLIECLSIQVALSFAILY